MEIKAKSTPAEFADIVCTNALDIDSFKRSDCIANTVKHSVMAVRNTAVGEVIVRNGFGHTAFQFQTPDYVVSMRLGDSL